MTFSVIFVNYNSSNKIEKSIRSIQKTNNLKMMDFIVVDNSRNFKNHTEIDIKIIVNTENIGFGPAVNKGVMLTNSDCVCVINPDTIFETEFIEKVGRALKDKSIGILTLYQKNLEGTLIPTHGRFPSIFETISWVIPTNRFTKIFKNKYALLQIPDGNVKNVKNIAGAFMAFRKATFEQLGGFDEKYFLYYEDTDLSFKSLKFGYRNLILDSNTYVKHEVGGSDESKKSNKEFMTHMLYSRLIFLRKWRKRLLILNKMILIIYIGIKRIKIDKSILLDLLRV